MKAIAFFDFDGTITVDDTFIKFGIHALGRLSFAARIMMASPWLVGWKLGIISNSQAKGKLFGFMFKGMDMKKFMCLCNDFRAVVEKSLRESTMRNIHEHQLRDDQVVIVSASIRNWIEPWARSQGINDVLATEVEFDANGKLTGRFATPNCYGQEKVNRITNTFGDISAFDTYAYGDSHGDDAMFALVKHPVRIFKHSN